MGVFKMAASEIDYFFSNLISRAIRVVNVWYIRFWGMLIPFMTIEKLSIDRKWLKMAVFKMAASEID